MFRNILAVIAGIVVAGVVVFLVEMIGHAIHPPPADLHPLDATATEMYLSTRPNTAIMIVLIAHMIGTFAGAWTAAKIGRSWQLGLAMIIGFIMMLGGIVNLYRTPHPAWMWVEVPLYLLAAWGGGKLGMSAIRSRSNA